MFRIYCKERPPVGIPVIEHLELNISPLLINLTNRFYQMMIKFFFDTQSQAQIQMYTNANNSTGSASLQRNSPFPKHAYNLSANDEQLNAILNLNLGINNLIIHIY